MKDKLVFAIAVGIVVAVASGIAFHDVNLNHRMVAQVSAQRQPPNNPPTQDIQSADTNQQPLEPRDRDLQVENSRSNAGRNGNLDVAPAVMPSPMAIPSRGDQRQKPKIETRNDRVQNFQPSNQSTSLMRPDARAALSYVGADPVADQVWLDAINDPTVPADERKQLIHDLNDDGLSDEHNPGPRDVPLILSRLEMIEELGPNAMDNTNAAAFDEAYRDLMKDLGRATGN